MENRLVEDKTNVIIVDDDSISVRISSMQIKRVQPESNIVAFNDPTVALSFLTDKVVGSVFIAPTLLFLDLHMPTMSAWQFIENATTINASFFKHLTVYILSASIHPLDIAKANDHHIVKNFLTKPLTADVVESLTDTHYEVITHPPIPK